MYHTKNFTVRCYEVDRDAIQRAADKAGKDISSYVRDVIVPFAYSDLNERRPALPPMQRGSAGRLAKSVAKSLGLTESELKRLATERFVAERLGMPVPDAPAEPDETALVKPKTYARKPAEPARSEPVRRKRRS